MCDYLDDILSMVMLDNKCSVEHAVALYDAGARPSVSPATASKVFVDRASLGDEKYLDFLIEIIPQFDLNALDRDVSLFASNDGVVDRFIAAGARLDRSDDFLLEWIDLERRKDEGFAVSITRLREIIKKGASLSDQDLFEIITDSGVSNMLDVAREIMSSVNDASAAFPESFAILHAAGFFADGKDSRRIEKNVELRPGLESADLGRQADGRRMRVRGGGEDVPLIM